MKRISRREALKTGSRFFMGAVAGAGLNFFLPGCSGTDLDQSAIDDILEKTEIADIKNIKLSVLYDNVSYKKEMATYWGFSCAVQGLDKTILFDTGMYESTLMSNMLKLGIDPHQIDELVISHDHPDHVGGAMKFLENSSDINVSLVKSFGSSFKTEVKKRGLNLREINQPCLITKNSFSTGEMKNFTKNEHSLVIRTNKGSIIITGCAHPGVTEIAEQTKKITNEEVLLIMGGFHIMNDLGTKTKKIVHQLKDLGVKFIAPSHCTGREAIEIFSKAYGPKFINSGVGRIITANDFVG